jgi:CHAD domain-containing protein
VAFRLKRKEGVSEGIRRIATGRAESGLNALRGNGADRAEAVHQARKDLKKLRAMLRLSRDQLGGKLFRAEDRRYRDAGRLLSSSRDAEVRLQTARALGRRCGPQLPAGAYGIWVLALEREREEVAGDGDGRGPGVELATAAIAAGRAAIAEWPLRGHSWEAIGSGLRRSYRKGRRGLRRTIADPSAENVHDWRKRGKDLTYQLRILREAWPELLGETAERSHRLTDLLGDHHDLELLAEDLARREIDAKGEITELIRRWQAELLKEAFELGERLYAEKPKAFERRLRAYWRAWRED